MEITHNQSESLTTMLYLVCDVCDMTAMIVSTATGERAWQDHMNEHAQGSTAHAYTWTILPIPYEDD